MKKILVVEHSEMVIKVLRHLMSQYPQYNPLFAADVTHVNALMDEHPDIFAAIVDFNLPSAPKGELVDYTLSKNIPTIALADVYDEQAREQLFQKGVVNYVTKEGRYAYNKAIAMVQRLEKNQQIKVLVADDSESQRKYIRHLLKLHLFQVLEAVDGVDAVKVLLENSDIKLLITDYNMPRMDGFELVKNVRYKYDKTNLIMIGISGESDEALSAKFITHGANDFLRKPFHPEEFYCRVIHNLEYLELVDKVAETSQRDYLTHLYHRHYFFNVAGDLFQNAQEKCLPLAFVVINVDNFRKVNESYGQACGDAALKHIATGLHNMLHRFLLCRADSDNFFVLMSGLDNEKAVAFIGQVRQILAADVCLVNGEQQHFSFSAGITNQLSNGIEGQIKKATKLLRLAKEAGGSMVLGDDDDEDF